MIYVVHGGQNPRKISKGYTTEQVQAIYLAVHDDLDNGVTYDAE